MDRSLAMADTEAIRGRDRRIDEGLGVANRRYEMLAIGESCVDCRR
jgi:hypothetical protein